MHLRPLVSRRLLRCALAALLVALAPQRAAAQETPPETGGVAGQNTPNAQNGAGQPFHDPSQLFSGQQGAFFGLGIGKIGGDVYASTIINTDLSLGPVGLGLALPLNILVSNDDSTGTRDSKAYGGYIRRHDWDEFENWLKIIRYVRYGHKREPFYVLVGQEWGSSVGHGTLVNRYNNSLNLDRTKFGLALDVNTTFFGFETLTDSVVNPALLALRGYVRPFGSTPFVRGWAVGATVVTDRTAPRTLASAPDGNGGTTLVLDKSGQPVVAQGDAIYAAGVDTEFELLNNWLISVVPFVDANRLLGAGNGLHAGVLVDLRIPVPLLAVDLQSRLEYRIMQAGYIPEYFDQQYDLGRFQYAFRTTNGGSFTYQPKATAARTLATQGSARNGYYGELALTFAGLVQVGGTLEDYEGPNGSSMGLFATLPKFKIIKLSGYYLRNNFSGLHDVFTLDERSLLAFSAAYQLFGPIYLRAEFVRQWQLPPNGTLIQAVDNYNVGLASYVTF